MCSSFLYRAVSTVPGSRFLFSIGITRGKIVIDDETTGQTLVFNGVNLGFDKFSGATRFSLSVEGPNGRWSASGTADGTPGSERGLKLSFANLSLDEILLATGTRTFGADFDMPLSGELSVRLQADGSLSEAAGQFDIRYRVDKPYRLVTVTWIALEGYSRDNGKFESEGRRLRKNW